MKKNIKVVMFDLDGTLLPMDQDVFVKDYFGRLAKKLAPYGYEPEKLVESIWKGTYAMVKNNGSKTNEKAFWDFFFTVYGESAKEHMPLFDEFYRVEFCKVQASCGYEPKAKEIVKLIKSKGYRVVLATNPIFPKEATYHRCSWAGLEKEDFELITTYDNSTCCKPNPAYYLGITKKLGVEPEECLMVGNDFVEDGAAAKTGAKVFILTTNLINKNGDDISVFPNGNYDDLKKYVEENL